MPDHDQHFKALLQEFLPEFFELFFPEWASWFDFRQVEWLDKEVFPDPPSGPRKVVDLVAKLSTRAPPEGAAEVETWLSLIHLEIESATSVAPLRERMHSYYTVLRERHQLPILPIALYLRVGLQGLGVDEYIEAFGPLELLRFRYLYVGFPALDGVEYLQQPSDLGVALSALMRLPQANLPQIKAEALLRLARSQDKEQRKFLLAQCVQAYLSLPDLAAKQEFESLVASESFREVQAMAVTWFEQGIETGVERERRRILALLLTQRFGRLSSDVKNKLDSFTPERLDDLACRVIKAESLKELGLE